MMYSGDEIYGDDITSGPDDSNTEPPFSCPSFDEDGTCIHSDHMLWAETVGLI